MKNTIFLCFAILAAYQLVGQEGLHLTLGGNSSGLKSENAVFSNKYGYQAGILYTEIYSNGLDFSTGARYASRGGKFLNVNLNYGYIDGLVSLGYRPLNALRIYGGGHVSALVHSTDLFDPSGFDAGLLLGLRFDMEKIFLNATYQHGLANIRSFNDFVHTRGVEIGVGLLLDLRPTPKEPTESIVLRDPLSLEEEPMPPVEQTPIIQDSTSLRVTNEMAALFSGFDRLDFIYKERVNDTKYNRLSFFTFSGDYFSNVKSFSLLIGVGFGPEYRKQLDDATYFAHGPQLDLVVGFSTGEFDNVDLSFRPGLGYLIGLYHDLSDRFSVGLEIMPKLTYQYRENSGSDDNTSIWNLDFSTRSASIACSYRFGRG